MSSSFDELYREYHAVFEAHMNGGGETTLSRAYALGRRALSEGFGVLDVAAAHQRALNAWTAARPDDTTAERAGEVFRELVAPFEMAFRGYRETNAEVRRLNALLARNNAALETVNRELESFGFSVSHDLTAPLRHISGFSQALLDDYAGQFDARGTKYLNFVSDSAQRMMQMLDGLRELSRIARGEVVHETVDLSAAARRIVRRLQAAEPARRVTCTIADGVTAEGDGRLLEIALGDLLGNAWKFSSPRDPAHIEFGRRDEGGAPIYFVRDDGVGFDASHARRLFGAFQRMHAADQFAGLGLGLATVERIVHRHGGRVWAESREDRGATFYFTLAGGTVP